MKAHSCREAGGDMARDSLEPRRLAFARIIGEIGGWVVPGAVIALTPKCPACLAAYLAVWTGLGVSLTSAMYLRWGLLSLCIASMTVLALNRLGGIATRGRYSRQGRDCPCSKGENDCRFDAGGTS